MATDNTTPTLGVITVWTQTAQAAGATPLADSAAFPWGWNWIREPRLNAAGKTFTKAVGSMGRGSFTILRQSRTEPSSVRDVQYNSALVAGQWVCITSETVFTGPGVTVTLQPQNILWWGFISRISYASMLGSLDGIGEAEALEVGWLLDQQQITGWKQADSESQYGQILNNPPSANIGDVSGYIVGNAQGGIDLTASGDLGYAFARLPEDCGVQAANYFTRWRLLWHAVLATKPTSLPKMVLACADGSAAQDPSGTGTIAGYLNDPSVPEVFQLRNLTWKGALDMCVPRSRGVNWVVNINPANTNQWQILIFSYADDATLGIPNNGSNGGTSYNSGSSGVTLDPSATGSDQYTMQVTYDKDSSLLPDEVRVEGAPIVWGFTAGFPDSNLKEGWKRGSNNAEDIFRKGASGQSDYNTNPTTGLAQTIQFQQERNAAVRRQALVRDVYVKYGLWSYNNADVILKSPPGDGTGTETNPLCPEIDWDGSNVTVETANSHTPYLPTASLMRLVPWPLGVKADGTDYRPQINQFQPQFLQPKVFRYDKSNTVQPWIDLDAHNGRNGFPSVSFDVEDRGLAFRLELQQPEMLAKNHWSDSAGGTTSPAVGDFDPDTYGSAIDYTTLVITAAVQSDQRLLVKLRRPGLGSDNEIRRRITITDENLQCWVMPVGTIIGLQNETTPDRIVATSGAPFPTVSGSYVLVRNDYPLAQRRLNMAAAWVFRPRIAVTIERMRPDQVPAYGQIGYLIQSIQEAQPNYVQSAVTQAVNTVVETVSFTFSTKPRIVIRTSLPDQLGFTAAPVNGSSSSPIAGGPVSPILGGTVAQAVQRLSGKVADHTRSLQRVPLIIPKPSLPQFMTAIVGGGNTLPSGQAGILSNGITQATSAWNPATMGTFDNGIGWGTLYQNGTSLGVVLLLNNGNFFQYPLVQSWQVLVVGTYTMPVSGGGSILCYVVGAA